MKKNELKTMLKPLIKECIKECIFEEGVLSGIITEVAKGMSNQRVVTETATISRPESPNLEEIRLKEEEYERQRQERIKRLNESVSFGEANVFEGTKEIVPESTSKGSPFAGTRPDDPGVDITGIMSVAKNKWKHLI